MFAIAWKEYRQVRFAGLAMIGLLVAGYGALCWTPWADAGRVLIGIGACFAATLVGALAFSEEKAAGTDVFLRTLPVGPVRRWAAGLAANLVLAAATIGVLLLAVHVMDVLRLGRLAEGRLARVLGDPQALVMLLALWSLAVFGSTVFENALLALLFAFVAGALVLNAGVAASVRLCAALDPSFVAMLESGPAIRWICVSIAAVCLASSCIFEKLNMKRLGTLWRVGAAGAVVVLASGVAAATLVVRFALSRIQ